MFRFTLPMALQSFRVNPFHTFLSILGIIIGVGALFSILSLADGMEKMARDQITSTSNLQSIGIVPKNSEMVDGIRIQLDSFEIFSTNQARDLAVQLGNSKLQMRNTRHSLVSLQGDSLVVGTVIQGVLRMEEEIYGKYEFIAGSNFTQEHIDNNDSLIVISKTVGDKLFPMLSPDLVIGKNIVYDEKHLKIWGVVAPKEKPKTNQATYLATVPITIYSPSELRKHLATIQVDVQEIEDYESEKAKISAFLDEEFDKGAEGFTLISYASRMEQLSKGLLAVKVIMGLIVGISVIVGGIGIMNVLLMSIKERTKEIGVRKAIGASESTIRAQFLVEAMIISLMGCALGVLFGVLFMSIAVPILQYLIELPFSWIFSLTNTAIIIIVALLIGIVFGTYPAIKAAKLDPIEAIRHE
ncbi:MAG: ABC transporter permease [Bacteroidia bacterium]|nr:ABC transporter permease [Bacteroidia bacterium]